MKLHGCMVVYPTGEEPNRITTDGPTIPHEMDELSGFIDADKNIFVSETEFVAGLKRKLIKMIEENF